MQRIIRKETGSSGIGTKAQQAIQQEREAQKLESRKVSREKREEIDRFKFEMRQEKKKEKKKGH
jgi:hypothetical protein